MPLVCGEDMPVVFGGDMPGVCGGEELGLNEEDRTSMGLGNDSSQIIDAMNE